MNYELLGFNRRLFNINLVVFDYNLKRAFLNLNFYWRILNLFPIQRSYFLTSKITNIYIILLLALLNKTLLCVKVAVIH